MHYYYMNSDSLNSDLVEPAAIRNYNLADWKYEKIQKQIQEFEKKLDSEHEISLKLISFSSSITMIVTDIGYQNPDLFYFYGSINGKEAQIIQHASQLNLLIASVEKEDKSKPARRIGFIVNDNN